MLVLQALGNAPAQRQSRLRDLIASVQPARLHLDEVSLALADAYVAHGVLRTGHLADARHGAIATVHDVRIIVSWNYRHRVNRRRREAFNGVNAILGYSQIKIVSPPEVFDE